jgi:hypothetical protein
MFRLHKKIATMQEQNITNKTPAQVITKAPRIDAHMWPQYYCVRNVIVGDVLSHMVCQPHSSVGTMLTKFSSTKLGTYDVWIVEVGVLWIKLHECVQTSCKHWRSRNLKTMRFRFCGT